jgi:hypothetical protein
VSLKDLNPNKIWTLPGNDSAGRVYADQVHLPTTNSEKKVHVIAQNGSGNVYIDHYIPNLRIRLPVGDKSRRGINALKHLIKIYGGKADLFEHD